jgi:hypothetical protein
MIYGELVDPIPSEKMTIPDDHRDDQETEEKSGPSSAPRLRFSEFAGAVGSRQALRMLHRLERTS